MTDRMPERIQHIKPIRYNTQMHSQMQPSPVGGTQSSSILPSPTHSGSFNAPTLPPIISPSVPAHGSAHSTHLQDLQHQVSVKSLAYATLQHEYDSLLQKLERQRTRCTALERKFEVSDAEINSLTDERDKLFTQIGELENQLEDLVKARDSARKEVVVNGAQYMRIVEMAGKLQAQSAAEKKEWEKEKRALEARIRQLERGDCIEPEAATIVSEASSVPSTSAEIVGSTGSVQERQLEAQNLSGPVLPSSGSSAADRSDREPITYSARGVSSSQSGRATAKSESHCKASSSFVPMSIVGQKMVRGARSSKTAFNAGMKVERLQSRTRKLECRLKMMIDKSKQIKAAASLLAESGEKMLVCDDDSNDYDDVEELSSEESEQSTSTREIVAEKDEGLLHSAEKSDKPVHTNNLQTDDAMVE